MVLSGSSCFCVEAGMYYTVQPVVVFLFGLTTIGGDHRQFVMILEGLITTINDGGGVNLSPMGPVVNEAMTHCVLRPFKTSRTYHNLVQRREAVFHVTDDVELIAQSAVAVPDPFPEMKPAEIISGWIIKDACRWYALQLRSLDDERERSEIVCEVVGQGRVRDFFGFNRAKHAVLEAAILATRTKILNGDEIVSEMMRLGRIVDKTAGEKELRAFQFLKRYIHRALQKEID